MFTESPLVAGENAAACGEALRLAFAKELGQSTSALLAVAEGDEEADADEADKDGVVPFPGSPGAATAGAAAKVAGPAKSEGPPLEAHARLVAAVRAAVDAKTSQLRSEVADLERRLIASQVLEEEFTPTQGTRGVFTSREASS